MKKLSPRALPTAVMVLLAMSLGALEIEAQTSGTTFTACRVPDVGAIYMIGVSGAPSACLDETHIEFSWTEGSGSLTEGSVTTTEILDGTIATADIGADAVTSAEIADGAVGAADIAAGAVGASEISGGAVGTSEVANEAITTAKLAPTVGVARGIAVVSSSGTLLDGLNVVSVQRPSNGATAWTVTFNSNVDVSLGRYVLTPGITSTCTTAHHAENAGSTAPANSVFVGFVSVSSGSFVDCAFTLLVF